MNVQGHECEWSCIYCTCFCAPTVYALVAGARTQCTIQRLQCTLSARFSGCGAHVHVRTCTVHVYVHVHVHIYIDVHARTYTSLYKYIHHMHMNEYVRACSCSYMTMYINYHIVPVHGWSCTYVIMYVCDHVQTWLFTFKAAFVCTQVASQPL